jgi:hypothetical protein
MKTYYFSFKNSEERISTYKANDYEEAVSFFASQKRLSEDVFLRLYDVDILESVTV